MLYCYKAIHSPVIHFTSYLQSHIYRQTIYQSKQAQCQVTVNITNNNCVVITMGFNNITGM